MNIVAGILTWKPLTTGRKPLLARTVGSLVGQCETIVFDNGSNEEYDVDTRVIKFPQLSGFPNGNTCGYGMNKIAATLKDHADIVIMSNDDIEWKPDAVQTLKELWAEAPDELTILSGLVEPTFALPDSEPWNKPYGAVDLAGHRMLVRKSVPGGAWTYRTEHHDLIFPVSTFPGVDDVPACHKLQAQGRGVACVDLATNEGVGMSTWGNASYEKLVVETLEDVKAEFGL